jgi:hypothetical protein
MTRVKPAKKTEPIKDKAVGFDMANLFDRINNAIQNMAS